MKRYWIARDKDGDLYIYNKRPQKIYGEDEWMFNDSSEKNNCGVIKEHSGMNDEPNFSKIKWEDDEPTVILLCN